MSLLHSYTLLAPLYDGIVARATAGMRRDSLRELDAALAAPDRNTASTHNAAGLTALLPGFGTGLDIDELPRDVHCIGLDLTPAMLARAQRRIQSHAQPPQLDLLRGNAMALPCRDASVDIVILHLILAVVPQPLAVLREAQRVVRPGGQVIILDKFLRPGQHAPLRRVMNMVLRHIATRTDVVFEPLLAACTALELISDRPASPHTRWFRRIALRRIT